MKYQSNPETVKLIAHIFSESGRCEYCQTSDTDPEASEPCRERTKSVEESALEMARSEQFAEDRTDDAIRFAESETIRAFLRDQYRVLAAASTPEDREIVMSCFAS